ncbi:Transcriptional regulator of acetoin/glycerol metabolism [Halanaerobium congolense]|uniref:Transcriptional regulator of acetoin/glycerol metabolism n=1 Tax=Halanaerobium congolense TaxID=54121 RepID=A0A1G6TQ42_9FIRM|nr:sigma-54-dependent Fis family transcriptional regulator [Halanaerobium congolense]KXS47540.1 MAG: Fis family transcriptional regulator [Halanaerobium sp. T82-1]PUU87164.1 MAG: Fis family transcriptional regulator [Halanaerobium sp.]PTX15603.1 transcriptional regulator of acetoin/glycerol metabolism [Halanaerobium congolense]TDP16099.1 transcriptional regulator of acetoin/glycerol metabolism [Halanaerobium congolense]SDD31302.1 Transcriptional regulator of acetoin/glycerol metabolism [Halana
MLIENKAVKNEWEKFVKDNDIDKNNVRDMIIKSWQRCKEYNVDPYMGKGDLVPDNKLHRIKKQNKQLIETAEPFMKELAELVKDSHIVVVLTNAKGLILETLGDEKIMNNANQLKFIPGSYWSEEKVGTNAIGSAIEIDKPLQVNGCEHYCKQHHTWTCSAAPIHNPEGELIGILDMSGPFKRAHPHTLGMVVAAAKSVENQISLIEKNKELRIANKFSSAVFNSMSEGIISIDKFGKVIWINKAASKMFEIDRESAKEKDIKDVIGEQPTVEKMLSNHQPFNDEDISVYRNKERLYLNASARILLNKTGIADGYIIILRKMKAVKKMVNRMAGSEARFCFGDIIGENRYLKKVKDLGRRISKSDATVLIEGESGTGKEMMAQAIHNESLRRERVFLSINCAAIPQNLLESELFGYEGGSFTGARKKGRPGKFELASGGTLLLDEIGEMPLNMQASLLRVLQEKEINRIGGLEPIPIDVRILASTNKDLEEEVRKGNFRKDLFFRLNTVKIKMPVLSKRLDDIEKLVEHFIFILNQKSNQNIHAVENEVIDLLKEYDWPGNVRELQNVIERAVLLSEDGCIRVKHLPEEFKNNVEKEVNKIDSNSLPLLKLKDMEKIMLEHSIQETKTITEAAKILGVSRSTFYRKADKFNLKI